MELIKLIKGRQTRRSDVRNEQMFRFPPTEEIWEVAYVDEGERDEREAQAAARSKRPHFPIAS